MIFFSKPDTVKNCSVRFVFSHYPDIQSNEIHTKQKVLPYNHFGECVCPLVNFSSIHIQTFVVKRNMNSKLVCSGVVHSNDADFNELNISLHLWVRTETMYLCNPHNYGLFVFLFVLLFEQ